MGGAVDPLFRGDVPADVMSDPYGTHLCAVYVSNLVNVPQRERLGFVHFTSQSGHGAGTRSWHLHCSLPSFAKVRFDQVTTTALMFSLAGLEASSVSTDHWMTVTGSVAVTACAVYFACRMRLWGRTWGSRYDVVDRG
jgi:hypothetical protein